jgi:hypothetical protein
MSAADLHVPAGDVRLVGDLTLDWVPVTCVAEVDLATRLGVGRLQARDEAATAS